MKNKLTDLNNHLFEQLERLNDEGLTNEALEKEISRTDAMVKISNSIIENAHVSLTAAKLYAEYGRGDVSKMIPETIGGSGPDFKVAPSAKVAKAR
jgi:hypothetical protein